MNLLDLGIVVVLALIVVRGYYRGLLQELAVLAGLVGGLLAGAHFSPLLGAKLAPWIKDPVTARWVAFAVILVAVYWLTRLVAHFLSRLLYHLYLDIFDRLLGALTALVKGVLVLGFALILLGAVMPKDSKLLRESRAAPHLVGFARQALGLLPPDIKKRLFDYLEQWQKMEKQQGRRGGTPT